MNSKKSALTRILEELNAKSSVEGSAAITRDGLVIASVLPEDVDAQILAAMAATMTGAAETAVSEIKRGLAERVIVESKNGKLLTTGAGPNAVLVALTQANVNLGLVLLGMKSAAKKIEKEVR